MALIEYELYSCLQFLARGNSRCFDSTDQVRYVVADFVQAEYIARMWNLDPAKVMPLTMRQDLKDQLDDMANKGRGRKPTKTDEERRSTSGKSRPGDAQPRQQPMAYHWQERKAEEGQPS